jgi:phosphohistidine swiveling domain-containing protein
MSISVGDDRGSRQAKQNPESSKPSNTSFRRRINGYSYSASLPTDETEEEKQKKQDEMDESIRTLRHRWDTEIRPTMEAENSLIKGLDLAPLTAEELLTHLDEFLDLTVRHWQYHNQVVGPTHAAAHRLAVTYREIMGDVPEDEPYKLIRGMENKSLETDRAIQALASSGREIPEISQAFSEHECADKILSALESSDDGQAFKVKLDEFFFEYGFRPTGFDPIFPTWIEDPSFVLMNIKSFLQSSPRDFANEQVNLAKEADSYIQKALDKLGDDTERAANFQETLKHARELWPLKEDHAFYIDQGSAACVRIMLAEVGRRLCSMGVICSPVDVFYLTLEEALPALKVGSTKSLNDSVSQRRNERDKNSNLIPPAYLGTVPEDGPPGTAPEFQAMLGPAPDFNAEQEPSVLRGTGGASGSIIGPAKVVRSPEEFGKIRPGDILVCTSTSPTWTPLFGTVAALVSDSGGVLSHTAIVAREYGLPAVVGVQNGTSRITDGQIITVDGDKGLVLLR